jgi:hypothetical protein
MDSISLLSSALARMVKTSPYIFSQYLTRHGELIKNNTKEIDCEAEPVIPWKLGYDIMKTMREVSARYAHNQRWRNHHVYLIELKHFISEK